MKAYTICGLIACTALLTACGGEDVDELRAFEDTGEAALAATYDDNTVVSRLDDGVFQNIYGILVTETQSGPMQTYYNDWGYWIDLQVKNLAYDKSVGVIWTDDNWASAHVSYAQYEADIGGGYERWGLDLTGRSFSGGAPIVYYAAFVETNGDTYYGKEDNWKNYAIIP